LFTYTIVWLFLYFSFIGLYVLIIIYHQRNPEKNILLFKIIDPIGAIFGIFMVFAVHLTIQPRIYGTLGMVLTPSNQIMTEPVVNYGPLPGLILSIIGFGILIPGLICLVLAIIKILKVINSEMLESDEILDTSFWGIVRNPIYTSLFLVYLGNALILGAVYSIILAPFFYYTNWLSGWVETTLNLEPTFGKEKVEEYKKKVPHVLFNIHLWILMLGLTVYLIILTFWGYVPWY
ncbi:MAG: hypothetical protein ACFFDO_01750, partial [Candidatus Thorarchaeota archaeon]